MGHNKLYELLRAGKLDALKDGNRTMITIESIRRYQAARPKATFLPPVPSADRREPPSIRRRRRRPGEVSHAGHVRPSRR
jgi:hypothetical protein